YIDMAKKVYRPDLYAKAAKSLIADKLVSADQFPDFQTEDGFKEPQHEFIDGIVFDGKKPNEYINKFAIGLKRDDIL
ncbi:MAG: nitrate ABC transporter substrate-binding protein, partial [Firmicutes bacterium]|nr:nitrate ABC transporter substrate-binding protein [Bacillota bacterium]